MNTTIALSAHTVVPGREFLPGGFCYILFPASTITVRQLIAEKVRAELRKARASDWHNCSANLLVLDGCALGLGPMDESVAVKSAELAFAAGRYQMLIDGTPATDLDATVELTKQTRLAFVAMEQEVVHG